MEVWHEHNVLATFPLGTDYKVDAEGSLLIAGVTYLKSEWSGVGSGLVCCFLTADDACLRCNPPGE